MSAGGGVPLRGVPVPTSWLVGAPATIPVTGRCDLRLGCYCFNYLMPVYYRRWVPIRGGWGRSERTLTHPGRP